MSQTPYEGNFSDCNLRWRRALFWPWYTVFSVGAYRPGGQVTIYCHVFLPKPILASKSLVSLNHATFSAVGGWSEGQSVRGLLFMACFLIKLPLASRPLLASVC